jgi:NAD(P)-dependent dehydrogenase (short-subunit alcohol dehydrogenase family)
VTRIVVVGASSGIGRAVGIGLARQGKEVALLARRQHRLDLAAEEAGNGAVGIACDVTDPSSVTAAIGRAATELGGIDAVLYATAKGVMGPLKDVDADTWAELFATNVTGAALVTAAALPHLEQSQGTAIYMSSISASMTPPWPLIGAYATSKAALDKLVEAWRTEHPQIGFTRLTIGDCIGGDGHSTTELMNGASPEVLMQAITEWGALRYITGDFIDVDHLTEVVGTVVAAGKSAVLPHVTVIARTAPGTELPDVADYAETDLTQT